MIVVADIGGTSTRVAASVDGTSYADPIVFTTVTDNFDTGIAKLVETVRAASGGAAIETFVVGVPGTLSKDKSTLLFAPHLPAWKDKNVQEALRMALDTHVYLENDAALGALGEAVAGAGVGAGIVAYIAVGTGIGGAKVIHGRLDETAQGFEIGHQILGAEGSAKEFEELVSGSTIVSEQHKMANEITDPAVWDTYARYFAIGLYNTILEWSPERVVLGGSIPKENQLSIPLIQKHLTEINRALPKLPELVYAKLPFPGLSGALIFAQQVLEA
jgi:predicted NBD/HSP70 family sugar kinase